MINIRKLLVPLLAVICISMTTAGNRTYIYDRWYSVDTLQCSVTGPGMEYSSIKFTAEDNSLTFRTFFVKINVDNPKLRIECESGQDSIIGGETIRNHALRKEKTGKYYLAGTNGDFYTTQTPVGIPIHAFVQDSQFGTPPAENVHHLVISDGNNPYISRISMTQTISVNDGAEIALNRVNGTRYTNELMLFNSLNGKYTHTSAGGREVALQLLDGESWKINSPVKCKVIGAVSTTGNMCISDGQAVLSADGTSNAIIEGLKEGDIITLNMGVSLQQYGNTPSVTGIMGGNTVLVENGQVTPQGDMARHPRTMYGYTKDRKQLILCVLDGRSTISSGGIYLELADVMKYAGADWAMNADGGGSSTLYVRNLGVMNHPSDGTDRAVSNGVYLVYDVPEDNEINSIKFKDWVLNVPKYGIYTPKFYGYNKYGMLIDTDVKGVKLSCISTLGHIENDTTFIGDGAGSAALKAVLGAMETTIPVNIAPFENIIFKSNKIISDGYTESTVDVLSMVNEKYMSISPSALTWSSDDVSIATVDASKGIIKGVADGTTTIHGTNDSFTGDVTVNVEIPIARVMPIDRDMDINTWSVKGSGITGITVNPLDNGMEIKGIGSTSRNPYIKLSKLVKIWSLPNAVKVRINPGTLKITKAILSFTPGENKSVSIEKDLALTANEINEIDIDVNEICDPKDITNYPIVFNSLNLSLSGISSKAEYTVSVPGIEAVYNVVPAGNTITIGDGMKPLTVYPNPVKNGEELNIQLPKRGNGTIVIYDELGRISTSQCIKADLTNVTLSTSTLLSGKYVIVLSVDNEMYSSVLLVK